MILAGKKSEVVWGKGNWIFLDIGFANKARTCGIAFGQEAPRELTYGEARNEIVVYLRDSDGAVNLVIEAPLSVCFDSNHNPKGRKMEKRDLGTRYWYVGPGCVVMTAALYLLRDVFESIKNSPKIDVHLFEGFVSFKKSGTDHGEDVCALRETVQNSDCRQEVIYEPEQLKCDENDKICSAFYVAGMDFGIPAVILAESTARMENICPPPTNNQRTI